MEQSELIERAFQQLINAKHLYQSIEIDFEPIIRLEVREAYIRGLRIDPVPPGSSPRPRRTAVAEDTIRRERLAELDAIDWVFLPNPVTPASGPIPFSLLPVRTLCLVCDDVAPFNLWHDPSAEPQTVSLGTRGKQVFCLPLQCQGCRSKVIVFMVARSGHKIQLVGRSEFEDVKAPAFIPKDHKRFYSQALIAFNCGQTLPALFLLRTLIEQHMRTVTGKVDLRGEDLCDEYSKELADDFKSRFPSFKDVYGKLSNALHRADPDESCFRSEFERVSIHFEGLLLFARTAL